MDATIVLVCIGITAVLILIVVQVIRSYNKKKAVLKLEMHAEKLKFQNAERIAQEKIQEAEAALQAEKDALIRKIKDFEDEERLRDDISTKTDHELIVDMIVTTRKLHNSIAAIAQSIVILAQSLDEIEGVSKQTLSEVGSVTKLNRDIKSKLADVKDNLDMGSYNNDDIEGKLDSIASKLTDVKGTLDIGPFNNGIIKKLDSIKKLLD